MTTHARHSAVQPLRADRPQPGRISYPGVVERTSTGYAVFLPDVPGCLAAGATPAAALAAAQRALAAHLDALVREGHRPPAPGDLADLMGHVPSGAALVLVDAAEPTLSERVNVWMPRILLQRIDQYVTARGDGMTRSGFLTAAARQALEDATG